MNEFKNIISQSERTIYSFVVSLDRPASSIEWRSSYCRYNLKSFKEYTRCDRKYMYSRVWKSVDILCRLIRFDRAWRYTTSLSTQSSFTGSVFAFFRTRNIIVKDGRFLVRFRSKIYGIIF